MRNKEKSLLLLYECFKEFDKARDVIIDNIEQLLMLHGNSLDVNIEVPGVMYDDGSNSTFKINRIYKCDDAILVEYLDLSDESLYEEDIFFFDAGELYYIMKKLRSDICVKNKNRKYKIK